MNEELFTAVYNPDVLSCIANLSNDEVFTPPSIANDVLDMLPQELFQSRDTTFLDPASKSGIFLREIAKRLLRAQVPGYEQTAREIQKKQRKGEPLDQDDESFLAVMQENIDHIFHKQLFGIAITELTSLLSRRSIYCSKFPNSEFSISHFDSVEGNIRFRRTPHRWDKNGNCVYCGASKGVYDRGDKLETHAYEFIHTSRPEDIFSMKFDVIVGNPPYQLSDGGNAASATPIYHRFVEQAMKLNPRYLTMIIPARWFMGGRGLDSFRNTMLHDDRLREIHDFPNASDCFPGVEIKGGVCYFLWKRDERGLCTVYSHNANEVEKSVRPLLEEGMETFIRNDTQISVLHKVRSHSQESFSDWLYAGRFFGFHTKIDWNDSAEDGSIQTADGKAFIHMTRTPKLDTDVKVYIHGGMCFVARRDIPKNYEKALQYKVIIPRSGNPLGSIVAKPKLSEPNSCSSNTYVVVTPPDRALSKAEAENIISYIKTKFFRFLVAIKTSTQDMPPRAYEFVPLQDFSKPWTDEELYAKYGLTDEEIAFIETMIKPMDLSAEDASEDA